MKTLYLVAILLAFGLQTGCSHRASDAPRISESQALTIAKREFVKLRPGELEAHKVTIHGDLIDGFWYVHFEGSKGVPGDYTAIMVDKATGKTQIVLGN